MMTANLKLRRARTVAVLLLGILSAHQSAATTEGTWRFDVYLDSQKIGYHDFQFTREDRKRILHSEARFDVKVLFVSVYSYLHQNTEIWMDSCLERLQSITEENGTLYRVEGVIQDDRFVVTSADGQQPLPNCVQTFAYWDPAILQADRLLNAQTGEYVDITVTALGQDTVTARGERVAAERYRIEGEQLQIDLWYSMDRQWLSLESTVTGNTIRYRLQ